MTNILKSTPSVLLPILFPCRTLVACEPEEESEVRDRVADLGGRTSPFVGSILRERQLEALSQLTKTLPVGGSLDSV